MQVPSLPANFGVKKLLSGEPASPLVNDTMSVASGYSTVTGQIIGPAVIARWTIFDVFVVNGNVDYLAWMTTYWSPDPSCMSCMTN